MGLPGIEKIREHKRINARIAAWIEANRPALHVPVDSPAANFPICRIAKRHGVKVVHFVAPQIWAWGPWRIHKLRRLTDLVLCLLPFEEGYFTTRGVPALFVGHPLFDEEMDSAALAREASAFGTGSPKIALMPGSRPGELTKNFPPMLEAFGQLQRDQPGLVGLVAAMDEGVEQRLRELAEANGGWPDGLECASGKTDAVIHWCDLALVVSGRCVPGTGWRNAGLDSRSQRRPDSARRWWCSTRPTGYFITVLRVGFCRHDTLRCRT